MMRQQATPKIDDLGESTSAVRRRTLMLGEAVVVERLSDDQWNPPWQLSHS